MIRYYLENLAGEPCLILQNNIDHVCTYPEEEMYKFFGCGTKAIEFYYPIRYDAKLKEKIL